MGVQTETRSKSGTRMRRAPEVVEEGEAVGCVGCWWKREGGEREGRARAAEWRGGGGKR